MRGSMRAIEHAVETDHDRQGVGVCTLDQCDPGTRSARADHCLNRQACGGWGPHQSPGVSGGIRTRPCIN